MPNSDARARRRSVPRGAGWAAWTVPRGALVPRVEVTGDVAGTSHLCASMAATPPPLNIPPFCGDFSSACTAACSRKANWLRVERREGNGEACCLASSRPLPFVRHPAVSARGETHDVPRSPLSGRFRLGVVPMDTTDVPRAVLPAASCRGVFGSHEETGLARLTSYNSLAVRTVRWAIRRWKESESFV